MRGLRGQSGVAMVTVLFVAAALTAVTSTAFFMSVEDLRAGSDDRRAAAALGYAEAGIDRFLLEFKALEWDWEEIVMSGCDGTDPESISGTVGGGSYRAEVRPLVCPSSVPRPREPQRVAIFSTGEHPAARRVVRQVVRIEPKGLPVGLYANNVSASGRGSGVRVTNVSLVTPGSITKRDFLEFTGMDPWYTRHDFYPTHFTVPEEPGSLPAAAHAAGTITCSSRGPCGQSDTTEHSPDDNVAPNLNCTANAGVGQQAAWDGSGSDSAGLTTGLVCAGAAVGDPPAPTSKFTAGDASRLAPSPQLDEGDIAALKLEAQTSGLYCKYDAAGKGFCDIRDRPRESRNVTSTFTTNELTKWGLTGSYVAFFDMDGTNPKGSNNSISWNADVSTCEEDEMATMIVPNGSADFSAGSALHGAVLAEKGRVSTTGGATILGTVIADEIDIRGTSNFILTDCWIDKMSFLFLDVVPEQWSEIDR